MRYDVASIGGGRDGYLAAVRAAHVGVVTLIISERQSGGGGSDETRLTT